MQIKFNDILNIEIGIILIANWIAWMPIISRLHYYQPILATIIYLVLRLGAIVYIFHLINEYYLNNFNWDVPLDLKYVEEYLYPDDI